MSSDLFENLSAKYQQYILPTYYVPQLLLVSGEGSWVTDDCDRRYLDFSSGISVCSLGHCHPAVTRAIQQQAAKLVHVSNYYLNEASPRLAEKLMQRGFDGKLFFCNSGCEANEGLIKFARKWGQPQGKNEIIVMNNGFHGRTLATLAATGRPQYRQGFAPDMPGFKYVDFNDLEGLRSAIDARTCAVMLEPIQGEGGVLPANPDYLKAVRALCDQQNILLLFDEVQCGMGRTGEFYAFQSYGVTPDALSMAKAMANGLPMGAFLVARKYSDVLHTGDHGSTFGGNPLAAAAALAVQEVFDHENVLENCRKLGAYLVEQLKRITAEYDFVKDVRGRGLMLGVVLDCAPKALAQAAMKQGLITLCAGENVLRLLPPLNVTKAEADCALEKLAAALKNFAAARE